MPDELYIFGSLFIVANMLDTSLERELTEFNVTTKQWLLSIIVQTQFDSPPSLVEVAKAMGSSYQNVKQIALRLQEKGLLLLAQDKTDARITRLVITDTFDEFWSYTVGKGNLSTRRLFKDISAGKLSDMRNTLQKLLENLSAIQKDTIKP